MEEKKQSLVPELRFPGFEGEWPIQPLSKFLHEHKTKSDGKCPVHSVSVSKGVVDQIEYLGRSFAASDTSKYNLAKPNDIIYTKSPTGSFPYGIVKMNKNPYNVIVSPLYGVYSPTNKYIGYIIDSFFESPERTNTYLSTLVQKGAKNTIQITNNTFISKNVCFPTDEAEQQKIAECLNSVDNLIQKETDQLQALKDHKKGLMQQLFPQDGETTPKRRFPGFEGEWEEKKLGEIGKTYSGLSGKSKEDFENGNSKFITFINVLKNVKIDTNILGIVNVKDGEFQNKVEVGDMLFNTSSETPEEVGFCAVFDTLLEENVYLNSFCFGYRFHDQSRHIPVFLAYYLRSDYGRELMHRLAQGITRFNLSKSHFNKAIVRFPSPLEQRKIADCLSSLDEEISAQQQKVEALKEHKKGLMQKLFPVID